MPGYVIHLAIGKRYIDINHVIDANGFLKGCIISPEIREMVGDEKVKPKILTEDSICRFIEAIANIDLRKCKNLQQYLQEYEIDKEKETEIE